MNTSIALLVLGAGLVLMYAAYRDESPIDLVLIALGRGPGGGAPAKLGEGGAGLGTPGGNGGKAPKKKGATA